VQGQVNRGDQGGEAAKHRTPHKVPHGASDMHGAYEDVRGRIYGAEYNPSETSMIASPVQQPLSAAALAPSIAAALPAELAGRAPALAALLAELSRGGAAPHRPLPPELKAALRALAGSEVAAGGSLIAFGSGNQFGDITIGDVVGGDRFTITLALPASQLAPHDRRNRRAMLARLQSVWIDGLLTSTFAQHGRAELGLLARPDDVARPLADRVQELGEPGGEPIRYHGGYDAYRASGGALLILGSPGSGKTIMLIELAGALLEQAEADESQPIPVILPLSSWAPRCRPIADWLVDALHVEYDVPRAVAAAWRDSDALLPLLDGLDEVDEAYRPACATAIEAFRAARLTSLVVCSRSDEYRALPSLLGLQLAVELAPLTSAGLAAVLAGAGQGGAAVVPLLAADPDLAELATTPLMLAVMAGAFGDGAAPLPATRCGRCGREQTPGARFCPACGAPITRDLSALREALVAAYVAQVFARRDAVTQLPQGRIEPALAWLATTMRAQGRTTFHLEDLQPSWLAPGESRAYNLLDRAGGALLITLACLAVIVPLSVAVGASISPVDPWVFFALGASVFGGTALTGRARPGRQVLADTLRGVTPGLAIGVLFGIAAYWLDPQRRTVIAMMGRGPLFGMAVLGASSGMIGMFAGALYGLLSGPPTLGPRHIVAVEQVRWSWLGALRSVPIAIGIGTAIGGALGLLLGAVLGGLTVASAVGIPAELADAGVSPSLVAATFAIASLLAFLFVGGSYGLMAGVVGGLQAGTVVSSPLFGAGLRRSGRAALIGGLVFGALAAIASALLLLAIEAFVLLAGQPSLAIATWQTRLYNPVVFAMEAGIVGALCFGGYAVVSHLALRLTLWRRGRLPWRVGALLEESAERALLRRIGGGYIFLHRIFLDYFASRGLRQEDVPLARESGQETER